MALPILLGELAVPLTSYIYRAFTEHGIHAIKSVLTDPGGALTRVGDLVIWNGANGQKVLAGLQTIGDTQARIEQSVTALEATSIATQSTLGVVQTVSLATFGLGSLTGALMLWRLDALSRRFKSFAQTLQDIDNKIDAQNWAPLRTAVQRLREFDDTGDASHAAAARNKAQDAANGYGKLAHQEGQAQRPRLPILNYRSRCYFLALLTELRCRMLLESYTEASNRFDEERETLESVARATFQCGVANEPEIFLSAAMSDEGVTLDLLTDIYRTANRFNVIEEPHINSPQEMFEHCRQKGIRGRRWRRPWACRPRDYATRLKFVLACFEDIARIEALSILARHIRNTGLAFSDLQQQLRKWCRDHQSDDAAKTVLVYAFT